MALPTSIPFQPYTKQRTGRSKEKGPIAAVELLLQSSGHPKIEFIGKEEEASDPALRKHYVGVYDPETRKLEMLEARKMVVRGIVRSRQHTQADEAEALQQRLVQDYREAQKDLGTAFGTKKAKKRIQAQEDNAIGPTRRNGDKPAKMDAGAAAVIASMQAATAGMSTRDELSAVADAAKPRPKANLEATELKDVYTIDDLIGDEVFKTIPVIDWQTNTRKQKAMQVHSRWAAPLITTVVENTMKLKCLRYIHIMIAMHKGLTEAKRGGTKSLPDRDTMRKIDGGIPESVVESIKRKFSTGGLMSKFQIDLMRTHICALACIVQSYEVDSWDLRLDLGLTPKEMQQYFREIGARITAFPAKRRVELGIDKAVASQRKLAILKIPLEFPQVSFGRK